MTASRSIRLDALGAHVGEPLGTSAWHTVDQARIDAFAEATGDRQWIHVDRERAAAAPPGTTIAHGYLTLSLAPALLDEIVKLEGCVLVINVGLDRLRFVSPVPAGSRVRLHAELSGLEQARDGGLQAMLALRFELEGSERPCCVADVLFRYYAEPPAERSSEDSAGRVQPPPPWESWQDCCSQADRAWARYVRDTAALWASIARAPPFAERPPSLPLRAWAIAARLAAELAAAVPKSPSG